MVKNMRLILLLLLFVNNAYSWAWKTHNLIAEAVYEALPAEMQARIVKQEFLKGSIAPDQQQYKGLFKWFHVYHPASNWGNGHEAVASLANQAMESFLSKKNSQASFLLGACAHYLADLCMPLHNAEERWETQILHEQVENKADELLASVKYSPKLRSVGDYSRFAKQVAKESFQNYNSYKNLSLTTTIQDYQLAVDSVYSIVIDILNKAGVSGVTATVPTTIPSVASPPLISSTTPTATSLTPIKSEPLAMADLETPTILTTNKPIKSPIIETTKLAVVGSNLSEVPVINLPVKTSSDEITQEPKTQKKQRQTTKGILLIPGVKYTMEIIPDGSGKYYLDFSEQ